MKSYLTFTALACALAISSSLVGQPGLPAVAPTFPALAVPITPDNYILTLAWTDSTKTLQINVTNPAPQPVQILGAQSTSGIFIVDFAKTVPAKGTAVVNVIYEAKAGTESDVELVRLKTSAGEKLIHVTIVREPVVTLETKQLRWNVGEKVSSKSVLVVVDKGVTVKSVNVGNGNAAQLQSVNATTYRVVITPQSTAKPATFPVSLNLSPSAPGVAPFITCTVAAVD